MDRPHLLRCSSVFLLFPPTKLDPFGPTFPVGVSDLGHQVVLEDFEVYTSLAAQQMLFQALLHLNSPDFFMGGWWWRRGFQKRPAAGDLEGRHWTWRILLLSSCT